MGLWPFATRGARIETELNRQDREESRDYAAFAVNDACVKLWLPERLTKALDRISADHDTSRPDVLRRLFFEHAYGMESFEELREWKRRRDEEAKLAVLLEEQVDYASGVRFSRRRNTIDMFGKATEDFKLWLPSTMHTDLVALAKADDMGLSDYLRKTLVRILLGERTYLDWQRAIGTVPDEWRRYEASAEI
jgi:hypothetical protein